MKYFSMFSGIGGFELGIQRANDSIGERIEKPKEPVKLGLPQQRDIHLSNIGNTWLRNGICVGYSEIDKYAIKVYERQFNEHKNYGDATNIDARSIPDFDLLVGGFPCQAFSVAGKRAGFNDTRGTLFFDIARILKEKRPRHLVLENVKGLLSHEQGKTFQTILGVLSDLGYRIEWQILNSKDFGVPQNRERVFIVGHLGNGSCGQVFPIIQSNRKTTKIYGRVTGLNGHDYLKRVYSIEGASPTLPTGTGGNHHAKIAQPVLTPDRLEKRQNGRRMKENGEPAFTLTGQDKHGVYDGMKVRRLTPLECERLQGFPDNWTALGIGEEPISDSQRYKMCGNAVTVNTVKAVMTKLMDVCK